MKLERKDGERVREEEERERGEREERYSADGVVGVVT